MTLKKIALVLGMTAGVAFAGSAMANKTLKIDITGAPALKGHVFVKCDPSDFGENQGIVNVAIPWIGVIGQFITRKPTAGETSTCTFFYGNDKTASTVIGSGEVHIISYNDATLDNVKSNAPYTVTSSDTTGEHDYVAKVTQS